ncbi:helix-turn-helix domain-containing protein [Paenibacillus albus]|uniref:XRE family transcriptional regulator n=1 Tax=Paenibacillus albus TaxID=2495582 RepID=A0A3S9ACJ7_9BACL|nr:helix-turn-helix transcriptional regulator [Paenibacillus albus]AZN43386.1 XRE family transcriptional regulator [Paenibacillus albus]
MLINYEQLRSMRIDKKLTLNEMAEALGLHTPGGYSRIESGENELKAKHLPAIAEKFGVELNQLTEVIFFRTKVDQTSSSLKADSA